MAKGIKVKLFGNIAVYIEQNQNVLYACGLSKGHMNNIWGTAESNNQFEPLGVTTTTTYAISATVIVTFFLAMTALTVWICDYLQLQILVTETPTTSNYNCN